MNPTRTVESAPSTAGTPVTATLLSRDRPARPGPLAASVAFAWRALVRVRRNPQQLFDAVGFPVMTTLVFTYLFGGALAGSTREYLQHLLPGIVVLSVVMISMNTGVALNVDISKGVFDRFRSMSLWQPSVLVGSLLGDLVRYAVAATVTVLVGLALGFRPADGLRGVVVGILLVVIFAFSLAWVWTALGLAATKPEIVMNVSGLAVFPLLFLSNIFVGPDTMPGWLQAAVGVNPITRAVTAVRHAMAGTLTAGDLTGYAVACAALILVFGSITGVLYNRRRQT
ncbi:ABC transporter permease [Micromonospora sp. WMMD1128]|uniref:ABC transporter permease n=1 Tax=Micromonospora sp. WMMD1128 TaxID=3015150 RepID=UPI00248C0B21|nr:ABC transporter permease [Micromonospora sp. WMMD1128]WBB75791.1 ABC transporter permease [Micromonospora sp. WMMD1128]